MKKTIQHLLEGIQRETAYTRKLIGKDRLDAAVMDAISRVPRQEFISEGLRDQAFDNGPLPIGYAQTISQPYIVALMTDLLSPGINDRILEIGTGCGYQTAILSLLCQQVYSVERIPQLSMQAQARFRQMQYKNIQCRTGNGCQGWPEYAPYDGIIVTAAAETIPQQLIDQLRPGGKLVIPVGKHGYHQQLMRLNKDEQGKVHNENLLGVSFVPLVDEEISEA